MQEAKSKLIKMLESEALSESRRILTLQSKIKNFPSQHSFYEKEIRYHEGVMKGYEVAIRLVEGLR